MEVCVAQCPSERRIGFQPGTMASPATQTGPQGGQWLLLQVLPLPQRLSAARPQAHPHQAANGHTGAAKSPIVLQPAVRGRKGSTKASRRVHTKPRGNSVAKASARSDLTLATATER